MSLKGKLVRAIKEAPICNELYRIYTEYKVTKGYQNKSIDEVFVEINEHNKWRGEASVSGGGSNLEQTRVISKEIPLLLKDLQVKTFLDLPCGDHFWMNRVDFGDVLYIGGDIVEKIIYINRKKFASPKKQFYRLDLTKDPLPYADLILVRDCLVHLPFEKIDEVLKNLKKSGIKYLLTTTFPRTRRNYEITAGNWRPLNLAKAPFLFPRHEKIILEECTESYGQYYDKSLALWKIADLPEQLNI